MWPQSHERDAVHTGEIDVVCDQDLRQTLRQIGRHPSYADPVEERDDDTTAHWVQRPLLRTASSPRGSTPVPPSPASAAPTNVSALAQLMANRRSLSLAVALVAMGSLVLGRSLSSLDEGHATPLAASTTSWPETDDETETSPMPPPQASVHVGPTVTASAWVPVPDRAAPPGGPLVVAFVDPRMPSESLPSSSQGRWSNVAQSR
jgi:hypothetical protein